MTGDEARRIAANPIAKLPELLRKAWSLPFGSLGRRRWE